MPETVELFVPGRLCLFGEHSDWAGTQRLFNANIVPGHALVTGIEQGISATAEKSDCFSITYADPSLGCMPFSFPMEEALLLAKAQEGDYDCYACGVASFMLETYAVGGAHICITRRDLPVKKGLSSSAAICVLTAEAFSRLYGLGLSTQEIMHAAYMGEQRTPSRCGRLDQACAFGVRPVEMFFDGGEMRCQSLPLARTVHLVFADLGRKKDTIKILASLASAYPYAQNVLHEGLQHLLGETNDRLVSEAAQCLREGDLVRLGALMTRAQALFDTYAAPLCPDELAAPALHAILADETVQSLSLGGKGVGSQGDGSVQLLARDAESQKALYAYLAALGLSPYAITLPGIPAIRKAIVPVAGFGTRMYPTTRFLKKELMPVRDRDGLVKPGLCILLEELASSGIEEICLVVGNGETDAYRKMLAPISDAHFAKLPPAMQAYEKRLLGIFSRVHFAEQESPRGFGDAVLAAQEFAAGEPVFLALGDTVYTSHADSPCAEQLLRAYAKTGQTTVSVGEIAAENAGSFGVLRCGPSDMASRILTCHEIVEKPTPAHARERLLSKTPTGEKLLGVFGLYALAPEVFDILQSLSDAEALSPKGELEFTAALQILAAKGSLCAFAPRGTAFDLGNPEAYVRAATHFS